MKQLIHRTTDGLHVVVALHDTVYYYHNLHETSATKVDGQVVIHELVTIEKRSNTSTNDNSEKEDTTTPNASVTADTTTIAAADSQEVQAVAVTIVGSVVWCAVARYDKSLAIYSLGYPTEIDKNCPPNRTSVVIPHTNHRTTKRISSLSFATVYGETADDRNLTVIVAGDVVGDAVAYSLEANDQPEADDDDDENDMQDKIVTKNRRLLLGHTASMLTSAHIVERTTGTAACTTAETRPQQLILTSDRDEKIRVSRFPETYIIEGYLLGHTAFVSSVAPIPSSPSTSTVGMNQCVSVGGDFTIRLWDYSTYNELAVAVTPMECSSSVDIYDESDANVRTDNNEMKTLQDTSKAIPTKVCVSTDGSLIATIYDDCSSVDFWLIRSHKQNCDDIDLTYEIDRSYRWDSPGQPLGIAFVDHEQFVLVMQEPDYIQRYKITFDETASEKVIKSIVPTDDTEGGFCRTIQQYAAERDIIMPEGLLEKDEYGCLKMGKMSERRGGSTIKPWNNISRRETNAERIRRLRKRRREELLQRQRDEKQSKSTDPVAHSCDRREPDKLMN